MTYNTIKTTNLVGKKESVVDEVLLLNPNQTPLINLLGFSAPTTNTAHIWYEDEMFATTATATSPATESDTTIAVDSVEPFVVDAVVDVSEERLLVTGVNTFDKTITVERGYSDTDASPIVVGDKLVFQFVKKAEGADATQARSKQRVRVDNYTQIFTDTVSVTGSAEEVSQYGIDDLYNYEKAKKQLELALQFEKALIGGIKYDDGSVRQMSGIRQFIKTNVINAGNTTVNLTMLRDIAHAVFKNGGLAGGGQYAYIVSPVQKVAISDLQSDKVRIVQSETSRGQTVDKLVTDFGEFPIIMNNNVKDDEIFFVDINRMAIKPLGGRSFFHKELPENGDRKSGMIIGEYTLEFKQEKAHARIKNLG